MGVYVDVVALNERGRQQFYCPNGHGQHYTGKTDAAKLAEAQEANLSLRQRLDQAEADAARKGKELASLKKRVNAGLCPQCHRHFANLARHVASKHPSELGEKTTS